MHTRLPPTSLRVALTNYLDITTTLSPKTLRLMSRFASEKTQMDSMHKLGVVRLDELSPNWVFLTANALQWHKDKKTQARRTKYLTPPCNLLFSGKQHLRGLEVTQRADAARHSAGIQLRPHPNRIPPHTAARPAAQTLQVSAASNLRVRVPCRGAMILPPQSRLLCIFYFLTQSKTSQYLRVSFTFSISSSLKKHPEEIHLTVSVVRFTTNGTCVRVCVCVCVCVSVCVCECVCVFHWEQKVEINILFDCNVFQKFLTTDFKFKLLDQNPQFPQRIADGSSESS